MSDTPRTDARWSEWKQKGEPYYLDGFNFSRQLEHELLEIRMELEAKLSAAQAKLSAMRNECHDAAEQEYGCFRAVQAERLLAEVRAKLAAARPSADEVRIAGYVRVGPKQRIPCGLTIDEEATLAAAIFRIAEATKP